MGLKKKKKKIHVENCNIKKRRTETNTYVGKATDELVGRSLRFWSEVSRPERESQSWVQRGGVRVGTREAEEVAVVVVVVRE